MLEVKLKQLQDELLPSSEIYEDYLHELVWDIDDIFGFEHTIFDYTREEIISLPDNLQKFHKGLMYIYSSLELIHSINNDGFLSIYYNCRGKEIERYIDILKDFNDPTANCYKEGYELFKPIFHIPYESNVITDATIDFGSNPYSVLNEEVLLKEEQLNNTIESLEDEVFDRILAVYREILPE